MPTVPSHTVYEDPANFVRLEFDRKAAQDSASAYEHPIRISERHMKNILEGLAVQERQIPFEEFFSGPPQKEAVFDGDEIRFLAPRLVEALAEANPEERVTFYVSRPQSSIKRQVTSGGLYVDDNLLHIVLGNHQAVYGIPAYGMVYDRQRPTMPISPKGFTLLFEPDEAVIKQGHGLWDVLLGRDSDEVVIDLAEVTAGDTSASLCSAGTIPSDRDDGIVCL